MRIGSPNGGSVRISSNGRTTVYNNFSIVQIVGKYSESETKPENHINVHVINYWHSQWILEEDNEVTYTGNNSDINHPTAKWDIVKVDEDIYTIQNRSTGNYIALTGDNSQVVCIPDGNQSDAGL